MQSPDFQHILRICNTNVDGRQKVMFALTAIKVCFLNRYQLLVFFLGYWSQILQYHLQEVRHRHEQESRWAHSGGDRQDCLGHHQPSTIQDPRLVPQQTKGYQGWKIMPQVRQLVGRYPPWGFGANEEDETSQRSSPLLGNQSARSTYQDYWSWYCWCSFSIQEIEGFQYK